MPLAETSATADERWSSPRHPVQRAALDGVCRTQNGQISGPLPERGLATRLPDS